MPNQLTVITYGGHTALVVTVSRKGVQLFSGATDQNGNATLPILIEGDVLSISGATTGTSAVVNVDATTSPTTPRPYSHGSVNNLFVVLSNP